MLIKIVTPSFLFALVGCVTLIASCLVVLAPRLTKDADPRMDHSPGAPRISETRPALENFQVSPPHEPRATMPIRKASSIPSYAGTQPPESPASGNLPSASSAVPRRRQVPPSVGAASGGVTASAALVTGLAPQPQSQPLEATSQSFQTPLANGQIPASVTSEIEVPAAGLVPAAFQSASAEESLTTGQVQNSEEIADQFFDTISSAKVEKGSQEELDAWTSAQEEADALFKANVGWQAYNARSLRMWEETLANQAQAQP